MFSRLLYLLLPFYLLGSCIADGGDVRKLVGQSRCGSSKEDAQSKCGPFCSTPDDCSSVGEQCFGDIATSCIEPADFSRSFASQDPSSPAECTGVIAGILAQNIEVLGSGIDIYQLNLLSTDPTTLQKGIFNAKVFNVGYFEDSRACLDAGLGSPVQSTNFAEPDGVAINVLQACSSSSSSTIVTSLQEYNSALDVSVTVSGSGSNAAGASGGFSLSTDFNRVSNSITEEKHAFASTTAECTIYSASLRPFIDHSDRYDEGFQNAVRDLPTTFDEASPDQFFQLFDAFGTHVLTTAVMGSRHGLETELKEGFEKEFESTEFSVELAANFKLERELFTVEGEVSSSFGLEQEALETLDQVEQNTRTYEIGPAPKDDGSGWDDATVQAAPSPIDMTLHTLADAMSNIFRAPAFMQQRADAVKAAARPYCIRRLGSEDKCDGILNEAPVEEVPGQVTMYCGDEKTLQNTGETVSFECPVGSAFHGTELDCSSPAFSQEGIAVTSENLGEFAGKLTHTAVGQCKQTLRGQDTNTVTIRGQCCKSEEDDEHKIPKKYICTDETSSQANRSTKKNDRSKTSVNCGKGSFARNLECTNSNRSKMKFVASKYMSDRRPTFDPDHSLDVQVQCEYKRNKCCRISQHTTIEVQCCRPV